jgi:lysophosphatidate acyltransferase
MKPLIFYLKIVAVIFWIFFTSVLYLVVSLFNFKRRPVFAETVNFLALGVLPILGIKLEVQGREFLTHSQPCIFIGNHQSALDVAIYGEICPLDTVAIGKKEIAWIPLFGWLFKFSGGILIDRKNKRKAISQIDEAVQAIKEKKVSVGILPEGTRNRSGKGMLPFKKGAFHLAVESQVPLVPIIIAEFGELVNFNNKRINRGVIQVKVLPPIPTVGLTTKDITELSLKVHSMMLKVLPEVKVITV